MNAVSFSSEYCDVEQGPETQRAPASSLARLVASILPEAPEETLSRTPSVDLIALASGTDVDGLAMMRAHYAMGEIDQALAVAATIRGATDDENEDPYGGLILVVDELVVDDADIEEIDNAFLYLVVD